MVKKTILFWIPAVALMLLGMACLSVPGFRFSAVVCFCAAAVVLCYWLFSLRPEKWIRRIRRWMTIVLTVGVVLAAVTLGFVVDAGKGDPEALCDYVIVLGAGVNGTQPSLILQERLTATLDYMEKYETAVCIVSGGQGPGEEISEAACMQGYLVEHGIEPERIWMEDRATSTWENIDYSLTLMEEKTGQRPAVAGMISNEFHLLRAGMMAKEQGLDIVGIPAETSWVSLKINYYLREIVAIWKYMILGG